MAAALIGAVIAYNEEALLGDCLASLVGQVDHLIVVDGRIRHFPGDGKDSDDATVEIAQAHGAEVVTTPPGLACWPDEETKRTAYLVGEDGDWYFMLDADEVLMTPLPTPAVLRGEIYAVRSIVPYPRIEVWRPRLFKHVGRMEYKNAHYALYSNGRRLAGDALSVPRLHCVWLLHRTAERSAERRAAKADYYRAGYAHEAAWRAQEARRHAEEAEK